MQNVIPEFAFANHQGSAVPITEITKLLREAVKSIYKVKVFEEARERYVQGGGISDDDKDKKYLTRGEFGELILHLLLRDFHNTVPLLSKIYFKDAYGATVHGFDAVHIQPQTQTLWLGESKLYVNGQNGIRALIEDIKNHIKTDYLQEEFAIISKKILPYDNIPERDKWLDLMNSQTKLSSLLKSVNIPLLCTYSSDNFKKYNDEALQDFIREYEAEVKGLKAYFEANNDHPLKTRLNIILLLFPVRCKNELVREMHEKLYNLQTI